MSSLSEKMKKRGTFANMSIEDKVESLHKRVCSHTRDIDAVIRRVHDLEEKMAEQENAKEAEQEHEEEEELEQGKK